MARLLTLTLNPALDLTQFTGELMPGAVNRALTNELDPAGKGINLARVLVRLGHTVTVSGLLGEDNAAPFEQLFRTTGLKDQFIRVPGQTRTNLKITERNGRVTELNGPAFTAGTAHFEQLLVRLPNLIDDCEAVMVCGSLPGGVTPEQLARLITLGRTAGKPVWLDTSGPALTTALAARPSGVKPNLEELADWCGHDLDSARAIADAARAIQQDGVDEVVVSLGPRGVLWLSPEGGLWADSPTVPVFSTVGAGDTLLAALIHGRISGQSDPDTLCFATALAAESVRHVGVGDPAASDFESLKQQARVHPWPGRNNNGELPL